MKPLYLHRTLAAVCLCAATAPAWAQASSDNVNQRLQSLEDRVSQLESAPPPTIPDSPGAFNPAISLVLSGIYANLSENPADYRLQGFPLPSDVAPGPGDRGLGLTESELGVAANIDPDFYGWMAYSIHPDDTASVEEAYIKTIALSNGFTVKGGRFFSSIGYLNSQHSHTWDFVDAPLAYQAFLGGQYNDDGVEVKWLAPTDTFFEVGGELGRGRPYPGSNTPKNGAGAATIFAHVGDDVGLSNTWRAGLSMLVTSPKDRTYSDFNNAGTAVTNAFTGNTRLWIADFVWKYAPNGNVVYTNFKLQAEYLHRDDTGDLTYNTTGTATTGAYSAKQSGWYVQGVYQFQPYWRVGLRTEQLDHGTVDYGANAGSMASSSFNPSKNSIMVDYSPSEFSRMRVQYANAEPQRGVTDHELFLQYQMSLGAHGAHIF